MIQVSRLGDGPKRKSPSVPEQIATLLENVRRSEYRFIQRRDDFCAVVPVVYDFGVALKEHAPHGGDSTQEPLAVSAAAILIDDGEEVVLWIQRGGRIPFSDNFGH